MEYFYSTIKQYKFFISLEICVVICGVFQVHSSPIFNLHVKVFYMEYGQLVVIRIWIPWMKPCPCWCQCLNVSQGFAVSQVLVNEVLILISCLYGETYFCIFPVKTVELWPTGLPVWVL